MVLIQVQAKPTLTQLQSQQGKQQIKVHLQAHKVDPQQIVGKKRLRIIICIITLVAVLSFCYFSVEDYFL